MARWLKISVWVLLVLATAVVSLPWWLGLALRPILRARSITFERYEREGYAHFRLLHATYQRDRVTVTIDTLHAPTPALWLVQWLGSGPMLRAENWALHIDPASSAAPSVPATPKTIYGPPDLRALLHDRVWPRLVRWLPQAELKNGTLRGPGLNLAIEDTAFDRGTLRLAGVHRADFVFNLTATPAADGGFAFTGRTPDDEIQLQLAWPGAELRGMATVWTQPLKLSAFFPARGWLPAEASVGAEHWTLPAARLKLSAPYTQVHGEARFDWRDHTFTLALDAAAEPAAGAKAPPFSAHALAHGTLRELTLTALEVNAPFATAKLSAPVIFSLDRPLAAESAELVVQADLGKFPWFEAHGEVKGTVTVNSDAVTARQTFTLESHDVALPGFTLQQATATGSLQWPRLELTTLKAQLDKTSSVEAHGSIDWRKREVTGVVQAKLGPAALRRWLPAGLTWATADVAAVVEGPLDAPRHHGSLKFTGLQWPPLKPVVLDASWQGAGARADAVSARISAAHSSLELDGSLDAQRLQLDKFQFNTADGIVWQLNAPARLTWSPDWRIDRFALVGRQSQLTLQGHGGRDATYELATGRFDSAWLQDWVELAGPAWQLQAVQASGHVAEGTLVFDAALDGQIAMTPQAAHVKLIAHGDARGLELKELTVTDGGRVLTKATGRLPVTWRPQDSPHLRLDEDAPLELTASTSPDSPLWATLAGLCGAQLTQPDAQVNLKGTLHQPVGDLEVRVAKVGFRANPAGFSLPEVADLALTVHFERTQVTLANFSARLDGQAVSASGKLPMSDAGWQQLWRQPAVFDWSEAEGKLEIPDADLAPFARHMPNFIAALGRLHAAVAFSRGGKLSGELRITDASSRPLPLVGPLQEINADVAFENRTFTLRTLTARLGGEAVTVGGTVTLVPHAAPHLELGLKGTRLPLVRNDGLLVRADLDLHATTNAAGVTSLTGTARIRDSLALANFNSLLPTGLRSVTRVPPYFAVQTPPFRAWPLAIDLTGPGAIKIRTTVFTGTASVRFHLGGTLGEPRAVGDLTVDQGTVLFPFAAFKVQQGAIRLSEADPFHANINVVATSQRRDYQLRLAVTGDLPAPVITLSSTPVLDATDVLLLVMTGRPPTEDTQTSSVQRVALLGAYLGRGVFEDLGFSGGEDRLEISSGEQVSQSGRETYSFEYKLDDRWSVEGEYDQFDSYNADLKRRIYVQESRPREKK
jgi:translocation and assembly module TamB